MRSAPFLDCLTFVDGTVTLFQNDDKELPQYARKIPEKRRSRLQRGGKMKSRKSCYVRFPEKEAQVTFG